MEVLAGKVRHYYSRIGVASIEIFHEVRVGDLVHIKGHVTDFDQNIESMQFRNQMIQEASGGMIVGIKVVDYARKNDRVYRVID